MDLFATLFGGLGLFFTGVKLIGRNLQHMAGRRFRAVLGRATGNPVLAAVAGTLLGTLTQSTNAATFIVINLITAGAIGVRRALPLVAWSNLGTSVLVLLAVLDLRLAVLYLLGVTGIGYYLDLDKSARYRHALGALLGLGTLFLGLSLLKSGAAPLRDVEWVQAAVRFAASSEALLLLVGAAVTMVAQSSATVSMLAVTMAGAGLIGEAETIMVVLGANLGSGLTTFLMAGNLAGTPRQLGIFQALFKALAVALLLPVFLVEELYALPLLRHVIDDSVSGLTLRVAWVFLACQIVPAILLLPFYGPVARLLDRLSPPSRGEVLARPRFLYDQALMDAESALELVEKEQARLVRHLPDYLDGVRDDRVGGASVPCAELHAATRAVARAIDAFQTELLDGAMARPGLERGMRLQSRQDVFVSLADSVHELATLIDGAPDGAGADHRLTRALVESLHALLDTLADTVDAPDPADVDLLIALASDRSELMERTRATLLRTDAPSSAAARQALFAQTALFERIVWLIRRFALLLRPAGTDGTEPSLAMEATADEMGSP
ncbi:Na/Pi symporter [Azospirillum halopraeferens]|uniref:Na/Pi symporter n=1 Tax=Azospirillum halopraeferens TaxID=34010 RepID=UPI000423DCD2|nr:Na/Pi symporter [Azospirillum halopraeferens]